MKILILNRNLLGDSLMTTPTTLAIYDKHNKPEITMYVKDDWCKSANYRLGIPIKLVHTPVEDMSEYDLVYDYNIPKAHKMSGVHNLGCVYTMSIMAGVPLKTFIPVYITPEESIAKAPAGLVLFNPYSKSCASHSGLPPTTRWRDDRWAELYSLMKKTYDGINIKILGGKGDYIIPGIPEEDHMLGLDLDSTAAIFYRSLLVVSISTGLCHLAVSQKANVIDLYPSRSLHTNWASYLQHPDYRMISSYPWDVRTSLVYQLVREQLDDVYDSALTGTQEIKCTNCGKVIIVDRPRKETIVLCLDCQTPEERMVA